MITEAADLPIADRDLLAAAAEARQQAYAPYSGFLVGAALRSVDGTVVRGCNVENAAYPATICAERTALVSAVAAGHRRFEAIAVIGSGEGPTTPCGICRQMLAEFGVHLRVVSAGTTGAVSLLSLADLLPSHFGPERLPEHPAGD